MSKNHILADLYRNSPSLAGRKATMTEIEEFARWFVELGCEMIFALEDGKLSLNEYPPLLKTLWGAKDAFEGFNKFGDEWKQAETKDYVSLANTTLLAITTNKIPKEYLQLTVDTAIVNFKWYQSTRTLLGK